MSNFADARRAIAGTSWLDDLARASLAAAEAKFEGITAPFLAVDVDADLDALALSTITKSVQFAVARVGHHLANPTAEANRVYTPDLERTRLFVRRNVARRIEFAFEDPNQPAPVMFGDHPSDLFAERAAVELAELLPETATDTDSMRAMPARDRASLNAIKDLVEAVKETTGITMHVHASTSDRASVLTLEQANELSDTLGASQPERERIEVVGRLDGVRTRRRVFYFEGPHTDYEGGFEQDLADTVKKFIDKPAVAVLERVRQRRIAGVAGRWSYRLLHLRAVGEPTPDLQPLPLD
jgi:hypothetical protein